MKLEGTVDSTALQASIKALAGQIEEVIKDGLRESGEEMARQMQAADRRNLSHDTFVVHERKGAVAVGPSKAGGRAHIVRFWEFGTVHLPAEGLIRKVADGVDGVVKAKMTKRLKEAIQIARR